jgi:hypothetical protein
MAKKNLADMFGKGAKKKGAPAVPPNNANPFTKKAVATPQGQADPMARPSLMALGGKPPFGQ